MSYQLKGTGEGPLPPILLQYVELKSSFPDYIMLYQIGDFFETFGEDAEVVAQHINLTLTTKTSKEFTTPMAGLPIRSVETHIERLLRAGLCIAIAEQMSSDGDEGLVTREITQLITPGTVTDESLLSADANYLAAVAFDQHYALSFLDLSTGEFAGTVTETQAELITELLRYQPKEILIDDVLKNKREFTFDVLENTLTHSPKDHLNDTQASALLKEQFSLLPGVLESKAQRRSAAMIIRHAQGTQQGALPQITRFNRYDTTTALQLDSATIMSLEILQSNSPKGSVRSSRIRTLFDALNATRTATGKRLLRAWLRQPLIDVKAINQRLDAVEMFVKHGKVRAAVRALLANTQDLERLSTRLSTAKATPRDLKALERTLRVIPELQKELRVHKAVYAWFEKRQALVASLIKTLSSAIVDNPAVKTTEGGFIQPGFDATLDAVQKTARQSREWMQELEATERKHSGISSLKVTSNTNLGFFIEITRAHYDRVPDDYELVQSLKDRQRYSREDVRQHQFQMQAALEQAKERELELFNDLLGTISKHVDALKSFSQMIARIDVYASYAEMAVVHKYTRPSFGNDFTVEGGRHAVVERSVTFMQNDTDLNVDKRLVILTGPNMSGKSTYLRQQALMCIMAQAGSFVPARSARIPIFEKIHTRIGASDDLVGGRSTFMVEMQELSTILQNATTRSLVLLDEIGRGTSTYDGLSIAWATTEYLHNKTQAFTLFATHYFELTRLAEDLPQAINQHVAAEEQGDSMVFYHQVLSGPASKSYGIEVARLAGMPLEVVTRAQQVLGELQSSKS